MIFTCLNTKQVVIKKVNVYFFKPITTTMSNTTTNEPNNNKCDCIPPIPPRRMLQQMANVMFHRWLPAQMVSSYEEYSEYSSKFHGVVPMNKFDYYHHTLVIKKTVTIFNGDSRSLQLLHEVITEMGMEYDEDILIEHDYLNEMYRCFTMNK